MNKQVRRKCTLHFYNPLLLIALILFSSLWFIGCVTLSEKNEPEAIAANGNGAASETGMAVDSF